MFKRSTYFFFFVASILMFVSNVASAQFRPIEMNIGNGMGVTGSTVCLNITVKNFVSVETFQFTLSYDATLVRPICPAQFIHPNLRNSTFGDIFSCQDGAKGYIRVLFAKEIAESIPDDSIAFTLCFELIGNAGTSTPVFINGNILDVAVTQLDANNKVIGSDIIINQPGTIMIKSIDVQGFYTKCDEDPIQTIKDGNITFYATGGAAPYTYVVRTIAGATVYNGTLATDGLRRTINNVPRGNYTILITDANGGTFTIGPININEMNPIAYDTPIVIDPLCFGRKNGSISIPNIRGGNMPYTIKWSNFVSGDVTASSIIELGAGNYTVTISDDTGCSVTESFALVVDTVKMILTIDAAASCRGVNNGVITINATGGTAKAGGVYGYQLNGFNFNDFTPPLTLSNVAAGPIRVNVIDRFGCPAGEQIINIPVNRQVNVDVTELKDISCNGRVDGSIKLAAQPDGRYTFIPLNTSFPQLIGIVSGNTFTATGMTKGNYALLVRDADGCRDTVFFSIIEPRVLTATTSVVQPDCSSPGRIRVIPNGGTGPFIYTWNPPQPISVDSVGGISGGSYTVTVTDSRGCTTTAFESFNNQGVLNAMAEVIKPLACGGTNDGSVRVNIPSGNGPFMIEWKDGTGAVVGNTQVLSNRGPGTYTVVVTDNSGCGSIPSTVMLVAPVAIKFTVDVIDAPCFKSNGSAKAKIQGTTTGITYEWKNLGTGNVVDMDTLLEARAGTYILTINQGGGCTKDTIINIQEPGPITFPTPSVRNAACFGTATGQAIVLDPPPGVQLFWSTAPTNNSQFVINLAIGRYWVLARQGACTSDTVFFDIGTFPKLALDDNSTIVTRPSCFGRTDGSISVNATGGSGLYTYEWQSPRSALSTISDIGVGEYIVLVKDDKNCEYSDTITLTEPSKLEVFVDRGRTIELDCNNTELGRIALDSRGGNPGVKRYTWQTGVVADRDITGGIGSGTYCATVTDNVGCRDSICYTLEAPLPLVGSINTPDVPTCNGGKTCISIKSITGGTGNTYTFQINNGQRYVIDSCVQVFAGIYVINLIDSTGCSIDTTISIRQPEGISVDVGPDLDAELGLPAPIVNAVVNATIPIVSFIWTPIDNVECLTEDCQSVQLSPAETTTYRLIVVDTNGCTGLDELVVTVKKQRNVYFANIFTPNGDGFNDRFQVVVGPGIESVLDFSIYDRWGNKVFEKLNYTPDPAQSDGWDGSFDGRGLDPGVFVYKAQVKFIDGVIKNYAGSVTLADKNGK